jgi:hypothetical protein
MSGEVRYQRRHFSRIDKPSTSMRDRCRRAVILHRRIVRRRIHAEPGVGFSARAPAALYARTHDHSTRGVATGSKNVSTNFDVPADMGTGVGSLEVVANGIPSKPVKVTVQ